MVLGPIRIPLCSEESHLREWSLLQTILQAAAGQARSCVSDPRFSDMDRWSLQERVSWGRQLCGLYELLGGVHVPVTMVLGFVASSGTLRGDLATMKGYWGIFACEGSFSES